MYMYMYIFVHVKLYTCNTMYCMTKMTCCITRKFLMKCYSIITVVARIQRLVITLTYMCNSHSLSSDSQHPSRCLWLTIHHQSTCHCSLVLLMSCQRPYLMHHYGDHHGDEDGRGKRNHQLLRSSLMKVMVIVYETCWNNVLQVNWKTSSWI